MKDLEPQNKHLLERVRLGGVNCILLNVKSGNNNDSKWLWCLADDDDDNSNILIFQRLILALSVAALGESISILMVSNSNRCSVCYVVLRNLPNSCAIGIDKELWASTCRTKTYGKRAQFALFAPKIWNTFPLICDIPARFIIYEEIKNFSFFDKFMKSNCKDY